MPTFNLVEQPWIPVLRGGVTGLVSLREAVTCAAAIDDLAFDDPLQLVAVLRQALLPVWLDALGAPRSEQEWKERWDKRQPDAERLTGYLNEHSHRFDLFDEAAPFAQVAGLRTAKNETKPSSLLLLSVAAGNNVPLFTSRTDANPPPLTPAVAAAALLAAHSWDTAGTKTGAVGDPQVRSGKAYGNQTGPLGALGLVIPVGLNLAQTLHLNTPIIRQGLHSEDRPHWRADPQTPQWSNRPARGLLDLLTFQARRIRLIPETGPHGSLTVSSVVLAAGDRLEPIAEEEPHTAWRHEAKPRPGAPARRPVRHQPGRAAWRGLTSLLATATPTATGISSSRLLTQLADLEMRGYVSDSLSLQVLTIGVVYGNQSAVVEDVVADHIPLPVRALVADEPVRGLVEQVVRQAEDLRVAANRLSDDVRRACGGDPLPRDKGSRPGDALMHALTPSVNRLLAGLQTAPESVEEADLAWQETARPQALLVADAVLANLPPRSFLGRRPDSNRAPADHPVARAEAAYRAAVHNIFPLRRELATTGDPA